MGYTSPPALAMSLELEGSITEYRHMYLFYGSINFFGRDLVDGGGGRAFLGYYD